MRNMKVRSKLFLSFGIVVLFSILIGVIGIVGMNRISAADQTMYDKNLLAIDALGRIRAEYNIQRAYIRDLALYPSDDDNFKSALTGLKTSEATMEKLITQYKATMDPNDTEDQRLFTQFTDTYSINFKNVKEELISRGSTNDVTGAMEILRTQGAAAQAIITPALTSCMELNEKMGSDTVKANGVLFNTMLWLTIGILIVSVSISVYLALLISGLISKPAKFMENILMRIGTKGDIVFNDAELLQTETYAKNKDEMGKAIGMLLTTLKRLEAVGQSLDTVASGDLTVELKTLSDNDLMGIALEKMISNLNDMFGEINNSTSQVSTGSKQIADGAQALAQGSTQQAAAVEQLSSSISEIAGKTKENAEMAQKAAILGNTIKQNAEKGNTQMSQMMGAVKEINDASQSISRVIKVIDDIAFQTNILALNAAVEAARAGQHGKGFAVVAEEVRSLAAKSQDAAKDTSGLIANSMEKAELGARIANETAASLAEIVSGINESSRVVTEIATSSEEQTIAIMQINKGIDQVAQVVQQNSATAEESAAASEEMSGQSNMLEELVAQFKLKNAPKNRSLGSGGNSRNNNKRQLSMPPKTITSYNPPSAQDEGFGKY